MTISNNPNRATITVEQAAELLGISRTTAYESVRRGEIPALRFGGRIVVLRNELDRLLAIHPYESPRPTHTTTADETDPTRSTQANWTAIRLPGL